MVTISAVRTFVTWQLMIAAAAVFVFFVYYRTVDPATAGILTGSTWDTTMSSINGFVDHQRIVIMGHWHSATQWRTVAYDNLVTPK